MGVMVYFLIISLIVFVMMRQLEKTVLK